MKLREYVEESVWFQSECCVNRRMKQREKKINIHRPKSSLMNIARTFERIELERRTQWKAKKMSYRLIEQLNHWLIKSSAVEHEQKPFICGHHSIVFEKIKSSSQTSWIFNNTFFLTRWTDDLELLLEQLQALEKNFDDRKVSNQGTADEKSKQSSISSTIMAQFDELDQALATLANTLNNVELELNDPGTSSSSSGLSESTTTNQQQSEHPERVRQHDTEFDEHFSDSGLSQSTESISLPLKTSTKCRTNSQLSTNSSVNRSEIFLALRSMKRSICFLFARRSFRRMKIRFEQHWKNFKKPTSVRCSWKSTILINQQKTSWSMKRCP